MLRERYVLTLVVTKAAFITKYKKNVPMKKKKTTKTNVRHFV